MYLRYCTDEHETAPVLLCKYIPNLPPAVVQMQSIACSPGTGTLDYDMTPSQVGHVYIIHYMSTGVFRLPPPSTPDVQAWPGRIHTHDSRTELQTHLCAPCTTLGGTSDSFSLGSVLQEAS